MCVKLQFDICSPVGCIFMFSKRDCKFYVIDHTTHDGRDQHLRCCACDVISSCVTDIYRLPVGNSGEL